MSGALHATSALATSGHASKHLMNHRTSPIAAGLSAIVKAALVTGCGFVPSGSPPDDGRAVIDSAEPTDAEPSTVDAPDGPTPAALLCDAGDANLLLCLGFDGGSAHNAAGSNLQAQDVVALDRTTGRVGDGGGFGASTVLHFPEDSRLDLDAAWSFEMFVKLDALPDPENPDQRVGVLDNDGQYSLFIRSRDPENARAFAYCNAQATVFSEVAIEVGDWHHLACVQDRGTLSIYVDGAMTPIGNTTPIASGVRNGTTVGQNGDGDASTVDDPLIGTIDELRVWNVARSADQIAAAAARR